MQRRLVPGAEDRLLADLQWAGLRWDEGPAVGGPHGPYKQSERNDIYQRHANHLLESGAAYRCFCTAQTTSAANQTYVMSGCYQNCAAVPPDKSDEQACRSKQPFTVRLRRLDGSKGRVYLDLVYGKIKPLKRSPQSVASVEDDAMIDAADTILVKSDGTPTYHFANVVDDHLMKISHVIRGTEWMASTPLHYDLYHAFGWQPPVFAHVGLLVDENKAKLSKRNQDLVLDVRSMREEYGVLPEALTNFVALLGWSNPTQNDVKDLRELADVFDLKFTKGNAMVRMEKLWYLQKQHAARRCAAVSPSASSRESIDPIVAKIEETVTKRFPDVKHRLGLDDERLHGYCGDVLLADSKTYKTSTDYVERNKYFFDFDRQLVPPEHEFYDQDRTISVGAIQALLRSLMNNFDFRRSYKSSDSAVPGVLAAKEESNIWFHQASARIHAAINNRIWDQALNHLPPGVEGDVTSYHVLGNEELPFTDRSFDDATFAGHFAASPGVMGAATGGNKLADPYESRQLIRSEDGSVTGPAVNSAVARKKAWHAALMRYLREKLSYGMPGPSIGVVMALLGYRECCKRLGVQAKEGGGW